MITSEKHYQRDIDYLEKAVHELAEFERALLNQGNTPEFIAERNKAAHNAIAGFKKYVNEYERANNLPVTA